MKQLLPLFLFLLPCLALAQYPTNGNQKITLGEQTTADGLIYRGVAATDTVRKPSIDTMAYMVLDTTTNIIWHYKKATSNAWLRVGGSITSGLTGVLPVANGGTGSATQNFVDLTTTQSIGGVKTFNDTIIVNRGIRFPATQSSSTNLNTLDDYEEGTFTSSPTAILNCSSINVTSTYYIKIGGYVYYSITGTLTVTASNAVTVLTYSPPFTQSTTSDNQGGTIAIYRSSGGVDNYSLGAALDNSSGESRVAATIPAVLQTFSGASANFYINGALRAN